MMKVLTALNDSSFSDNTIIVFTSDHGEQLGAHGGLYQKWYNMYEESIHVPFVISTPSLHKKAKQTDDFNEPCRYFADDTRISRHRCN